MWAGRCRGWAGACVTVAAVGITDQTGVTALPRVPSGVGAQNVGVLQAPRQRALCHGQLTVSYLWF